MSLERRYALDYKELVYFSKTSLIQQICIELLLCSIYFILEKNSMLKTFYIRR